MQQLSDLLTSIDSAIGGSQWFVFLLLGTGNIAGVAFALHLGGGTGSTFLGAGNGGNWYDHQICGGNPLAQEVKTEVKSFWNEYAERFPEEKPPRY